MTFLQLFAYLVQKVYSHCLKLLMKGGCHRGLMMTAELIICPTI